jgi:hypothetical protein
MKLHHELLIHVSAHITYCLHSHYQKAARARASAVINHDVPRHVKTLHFAEHQGSRPAFEVSYDGVAYLDCCNLLSSSRLPSSEM